MAELNTQCKQYFVDPSHLVDGARIEQLQATEPVILSFDYEAEARRHYRGKFKSRNKKWEKA